MLVLVFQRPSEEFHPWGRILNQLCVTHEIFVLRLLVDTLHYAAKYSEDWLSCFYYWSTEDCQYQHHQRTNRSRGRRCRLVVAHLARMCPDPKGSRSIGSLRDGADISSPPTRTCIIHTHVFWFSH